MSSVSTNSTSHEVKGIQNKNSYTYNFPPKKEFGVTTLINTSAHITVNIYAEDAPDTLIYTVDGTGARNNTYSGICTTGNNGKIRVEILAAGKPVKQTKYAFHIFDDGYTPQLAVLAAEDGGDADFNDAIVILNWPLG
jgi:mannose-binding lectin